MTVASYDTREVGSQPAPEARLAELARAGGPLRRAAAAVAGRMVACRGWERLGYARPGDYARERLGLSARTLQEWARVDGRLVELPGLEAVLVSGVLPWSKVRLLARCATRDDEAGWITHAGSCSVRVLARQVRVVDRGALETGGLLLDEEGAEREPTERVRISGSQAACLEWQRVRKYAARVAGERLAPVAVLEMVTAEALSALPLDAEAQEMVEAPTGEGAVQIRAGSKPTSATTSVCRLARPVRSSAWRGSPTPARSCAVPTATAPSPGYKPRPWPL